MRDLGGGKYAVQSKGKRSVLIARGMYVLNFLPRGRMGGVSRRQLVGVIKNKGSVPEE